MGERTREVQTEAAVTQEWKGPLLGLWVRWHLRVEASVPGVSHINVLALQSQIILCYEGDGEHGLQG